ncbi:MAG: hypothetical protein JSV31_29810 [Desulfobacterales bacterium]|nr:MAG: hypothetical protein JSV31_29810 [Desulfobacterales bacterium]
MIFAAAALVCAFSVPASAVEWNFYGSARVETTWNSSDGGDTGSGDVEDSELTWRDTTGSRIGARVKGENISGLFEIKFLGGDNPSDTEIVSKHLYGEWDFGAGKFLVGKTYAGIQQFISAQMWAGDTGLLGLGAMYGGRPYQLALSFGGFRIALADPNSSLVSAVTFVENGVTLGTIPGMTGGDVDEIFPKIEARYGMAFDQFSFNITGGYQHYEIEEVPSVVVPGTTNDVDVDSWSVGADAAVNFGPAYLKGCISFTRNGGNAGWTAAAGTWDGDDDIDDADTLQGALVVGFKMSDQITFEGGFGYRSDDYDVSGAKDDDTYTFYGNATVALAPGVWVIPEIGYFDYDENAAGTDEGDAWYAGAKWQIDF